MNDRDKQADEYDDDDHEDPLPRPRPMLYTAWLEPLGQSMLEHPDGKTNGLLNCKLVNYEIHDAYLTGCFCRNCKLVDCEYEACVFDHCEFRDTANVRYGADGVAIDIV